MNKYPYGKRYQTLAAKFALKAGCSGNQMGIFYYLCAHKFDWTTGQTPEISHRSIAEDMGISYNAVQRAITALIGAGVIAHEKRGVVWANGAGRANLYKFAIPSTPTPKQGRAPHQKEEEPHPKTGQHYINPYIQKKGASAHKDAPRRGGGDKVDEVRAEEIRLFGRECSAYGYEGARRREEARNAAKDK